MGITYSDTHELAPYSDYAQISDKATLEETRGNAEDIIEAALADPRIRFCVQNGDIDEVVNLPVKHLPVTPDEQDTMRMQLVKTYAFGKRVVLSEEKLHKVPLMGNADLGSFLWSIHEKGLAVAQMHLPPALGSRFEQLMRDPDEAMADILRKTKLRDEKMNEIAAKHMTHQAEMVTRFPHVAFHRVIGNHERMKFFIGVLKTLSDDINKDWGRTRFTVHERHVRIGDGHFIHTDQQLTPHKYFIGRPEMYDEAQKELERGFQRQVIEDHGNKIVPAGILAHSIHTPWQCAYDIMHWYQQNDPGALKGVKHIYGGHTHSPFTNYRFVYPSGGEVYTAHNTGAALSRFTSLNKEVFNPLRITMRVNAASPAETDDPDVFHPHASTRAVDPVRQRQMQRA